MRDIVMKYDSLVEYGQWSTKYERDVKIFALTSHMKELNILLPKQSTYKERNKNINVGNTRFTNSVNTWKSTAPISCEYCTK